MAEGAAPSLAPGAWAGRLEVPSAVARAHGLALALNASFFRAEAVEREGRKLAYVVGNGATPVGWHVSGGQVRSRPTAPRFRAALVVRTSGRVTVEPRLEEVPTDARCVVSGNALVLQGGEPVPSRDEARHPRSAVGLSADGRTLLLVAVDGRQEHSRGATLEELGRLLKDFGATDALNLDGGGSTAMAARDPVTGVIAVLNRPSDLAPGLPDTRVERPVADVLGIVLREPASAPPRVP